MSGKDVARTLVPELLAWRHRITSLGAAAAGAAAATWGVHVRKQPETEDTGFAAAFADAIAHMGNASSIVRLGGVYAMAALADRHQEHQQQCIDALCGYLRLPYYPTRHPALVTETITRTGYPSDAQITLTHTCRAEDHDVRLTIIRLIRDHLRDPDAANTWCGRDFDFSGATFDGGDFSYTHFTGGRVSFEEAKFPRGTVSFVGANFSGASTIFDHACFSTYVSFDKASFSGQEVTFDWTHFCEGGRVTFKGATFSGQEVSFHSTEFTVSQVSFIKATFAADCVLFNAVQFSELDVVPDEEDLFDPEVTFDGAEIFKGAPGLEATTAWAAFLRTFHGATFSAGTVNVYEMLLFEDGIPPLLGGKQTCGRMPIGVTRGGYFLPPGERFPCRHDDAPSLL